MQKNKNLKFFWKKHSIAFSCIMVVLLCLIVFLFWYSRSRTYLGNITVESEDGEILNIRLELNAHRSLLKPEEFGGSIFIDGKEYISAFFVENKEDKEAQFVDLTSSYAEFANFGVPYDRGNWLKNLQAKMEGEKWVPFFVLKDQENTKNTIRIENLPELFKQKSPEKCNIVVHKDKKIYTIKEVVEKN